MATENASAPFQQPKILYCLDFDGVLCDSVHETFLSGWRACRILWDNNHNNENERNWIQFFRDNPEEFQKLETDFRFVRPVLYVGWEAILLIRLLSGRYHGTPEELLGTTFFRDAVFEGFQNEQKDRCLSSWELDPHECAAAMARARNSWIREDETSWLDAHGVYRGACSAVRNYLNQHGNEDVYVITTKAKEFALRLLEKQDLYRSKSNGDPSAFEPEGYFKDSHVFGLGSGPKASVLQRILKKRREYNNDNGVVAVMVEDNVGTLDKISRSPVGNRVLPVVASWGYNSIHQLEGVLRATVPGASASASASGSHALELFMRAAVSGASGSSGHPQQATYVVLPLLKDSFSCPNEPSATPSGWVKDLASGCKQIDPTGCSLACVLQTPSDAGSLLDASRGGSAGGDNVYDFSSKRDVASDWFRKQQQQQQKR